MEFVLVPKEYDPRLIEAQWEGYWEAAGKLTINTVRDSKVICNKAGWDALIKKAKEIQEGKDNV